MSGHVPGKINDDEMTRLKSNALDDELVRMALAGFLHQEFTNVHGVRITCEAIYRAVCLYVEAIRTTGMLDDVQTMFNAGFRPPR